jgi:hypothetical protein
MKTVDRGEAGIFLAACLVALIFLIPGYGVPHTPATPASRITRSAGTNP